MEVFGGEGYEVGKDTGKLLNRKNTKCGRMPPNCSIKRNVE